MSNRADIQVGQVVKFGQAKNSYHNTTIVGQSGVYMGEAGGFFVFLTMNGTSRQYMDVSIDPNPPGDADAVKGEIIKAHLTRGFNAARVWKIGVDPEVFAAYSKSGLVCPAWTYLPDKANALQFTSIENLGRAFWDGYQAEFTVSPARCHAYGVDSVFTGLSTIAKQAHSHHAALTPSCVMDVDARDYPVGAPMLDMGCAPSLNAYGERLPLMGINPQDIPFRSAGFHIHYGCGKVPESVAVEMVKCLDKIVGVLSVHVLKGLEDPRRRLYYGLAGEYRLPAHGVEYRTLSSTAMIHPVLVHLLFDLSRTVTELSLVGLGDLWRASDGEVEHVINTLDEAGAADILGRNSKLLEQLMACVYAPYTPARANSMKLIHQGAAKTLPTEDMEKNWHIFKTRDTIDSNIMGWITHCERRGTAMCTMNYIEKKVALV